MSLCVLKTRAIALGIAIALAPTIAIAIAIAMVMFVHPLFADREPLRACGELFRCARQSGSYAVTVRPDIE